MRTLGFCHEHALILYVYLSNDDVESVLTVCDESSDRCQPYSFTLHLLIYVQYYIASYSA